jgi:hypothetical protein
MRQATESIEQTCPLCGRPDWPTNMLHVAIEHRANYWGAQHLLCFQCIDAVMTAARAEIAEFNAGVLGDGDFHFGLGDSVADVDLPLGDHPDGGDPVVSSDGSGDGDSAGNDVAAHGQGDAPGEPTARGADSSSEAISGDAERSEERPRRSRAPKLLHGE